MTTQNALEAYANATTEMDTLLDTYQYQDFDYVREFVGVFRSVFQESGIPLINGFFCIVPALCLNWMDAIILGKEMMHKKNITRDGYYTDDGFAVGLTFCLVVLEQIKHYER